MATLFLICGLPGAGKTTLAKKLEQLPHTVRLSPDEWIFRLLPDVTDRQERDRLRAPIEAMLWEMATRLLAIGVNVILDWGFWSREERREYRTKAEALGACVEMRFLEVERNVLWERLSKRNVALPPGTFAVTQAELDLWWSWYEPPTADELEANRAESSA